MADTRIQLEVEDWVRRDWMPKKYGQGFRKNRVPLSSGGVFDFDAVSTDKSIVANISTSGATTAGGKNAAGKLMKIRSDMFFLLLVKAERRIIILTERDMYDRCLKEVDNGRVPTAIEIARVEIPEELSLKLQEARKVASDEVSPQDNL